MLFYSLKINFEIFTCRIRILNNIGVAFIKMGKYEDALSTFEHCLDEKPDFKTALNLGICSDFRLIQLC